MKSMPLVMCHQLEIFGTLLTCGRQQLDCPGGKQPHKCCAHPESIYVGTVKQESNTGPSFLKSMPCVSMQHPQNLPVRAMRGPHSTASVLREPTRAVHGQAPQQLRCCTLLWVLALEASDGTGFDKVQACWLTAWPLG